LQDLAGYGVQRLKPSAANDIHKEKLTFLKKELNESRELST
jgi:hypothetical protein